MTRTWKLRKDASGGGIQATEEVDRWLLLVPKGLGLSLGGAGGDWLTGDSVSEGCGEAASENMEAVCSLKPAAELA